MEKKAIKYTFRGMNQDVSEGKHPLEFFYEANNIRFITTSERITGGIAFEKGNELKLTLPDISITQSASLISISNGQKINYKKGNEIDVQLSSNILTSESGDQTIIGHATTRDSIILFSTGTGKMDCIWEVNMNDYSIKLLYLRNLNFSTSNPIQGLYNYENKRIEKIYWVDGENQIRFINTKHSLENGNAEELININSNTINIVGNFDINQPRIVNVVSGGTHTSGMIQYAYNLYRLNSSQTKLSPLSSLTPLAKGVGQGGGDLNEIVGATPVIEIKDLDPEYTHIKVYAVKYTSYNELPSISLIKDKEIPSSNEITIFDDGTIEAEISLEEFLFLGSDPIIPKHIESKDNILFSSNIKEQSFDVKIDTRAYSYNQSQLPSAEVYDDVKLSEFTNRPFGPKIKLTFDNYTLPEKHDAINLNYDTFKWQRENNNKLGGEGKYLKYEIIQDQNIKNPETKKFFKDSEIYRLGVQFYNRLGQTSLPKWIADYKMPEGNLEGKYNVLEVVLKPEFYVWLNDSANFESENDKPVGYRILRANRTQNDKTILTQGFLNGMMSNYRTKDSNSHSTSEDRRYAISGNKLPSLQRVFGKHAVQMEPVQHYAKLNKDSNNENNERNEVAKSKGADGMRASTFQFNSIIQMFSPEVLFSTISSYEDLVLNVKGANLNKSDKFWGQEKVITTQEIERDGKVLNGLTPRDTSDDIDLVGNTDDLADFGIFGPSGAETSERMDFFQFYRDFTEDFIPSANEVRYPIFGKPEITEKGQGGTDYNSNSQYKYYNSLQSMITDNIDSNDEGERDGLTSVNSWGAKNLTMVLGADGLEIDNRPTLDQLYQKTNINETNVMLVGELVKNKIQIYLGGIYGGNSYEDKKRTSYIEIGEYSNINEPVVFINSPGDTFVQNFRFAKITKTDTEVYSKFSSQITEIVEGKIETTIDLKNRNDMSINGWDTRFQPRESEYHNYNRVYSQESTLIQTQDLDYNFRRIKNFDGRIMASKIKTPGEYIDNWTDLLVNEVIDMNGKFGPINGMCSFEDEIYAFQDNAFAKLSINPRVQTQADDGLAIELGTGKVLHDYNYISTSSGCINKWGIQVSSNGIYYLDALNKSIFRLSGRGLEGLSSLKGLHKYLVDMISVENLRKDNPILNTGVSMGYDLLNNDIYLTYNNEWTLCFNEKMDQFTGFYAYNAPMYIYTKEKLLTVNPGSKNQMFETHAGKYNEFYGQRKESSITFVANPEADHECVFTNLEWKSVARDAGNKEVRYTWDTVRIYNEFQDSGVREISKSNMRKLNRMHRMALPRNKNTTDRIRNNWSYIKLTGDNPNQLFYLNQDIILHYIANYIMLR